MADTQENFTSTIFDQPKGGLYSGSISTVGLDPNVKSELMDYRWTTSFNGSQPATVMTYAFPTSAADYSSIAGGYPDTQELDQFAPVTQAQMNAVRTALGLVASYTNLVFNEVASGLASDATLRFAQYTDKGSESRFPANGGPYAISDSRVAGDTWLGGNGKAPAAYFGTDALNTIMHEMGHAFGLKHGHDGSFNGALAPQFNDNEFSVMSYASYFGANTAGSTEAIAGSSPQSYMMFDIAALQELYGANFGRLGTTAVYKWDPVTGQETINGIPAPNTGASSTGKIFSTVWTAGATATYDLSAFNEDQVDDLRPGQWLTFSKAQIADLNNEAAAGTAQYQAQGNIYNALLYHGDARSLISNIITGNGNDKITGNDGNNVISAGAGNDWISGGNGNDIISGGAGADTIIFGSGRNILRDKLADLQGDTVYGFGKTGTLDILDARYDPAAVHSTKTADGAMLTIGSVSFELKGDYTGGDFMSPVRKVGGTTHMDISFVNYTPSLSEGSPVAKGAVNGIADEDFLMGDGDASFTMHMESAGSAYANTLGYYFVGDDGRISNVHLAYTNTLASGNAQKAIALGTPGPDQHIGFFLVQNGHNIFGDLPDDLMFVSAAGSGVANVDSGAAPILVSASRGVLTGATVFHSYDELNPGHDIHVLSGTETGGDILEIGFEDLPSAIADNDFQDVVISIHATYQDVMFA
ncbi:serralysin [Azorhizobium sp. AG788]|uniref:M10 family metallopeptidase n=1 Tax=Azorhizobium sp. AG788 TaxID=2183897 RepID=UPI00105C807A|nr:M10 family metallopeptidase [Azorhizobium sp. AG788]TDT99814.1 serralysin [Azorhizobium sp. AG788]